MNIDKKSITERLDRQADTLDCMLNDFQAQFSRALDSLNAVAEGIDPQALPLQRLTEMGRLDTVLCIIENLSRNPERIEAVLEVSAGAPLTIVRKCIPYSKPRQKPAPARGARPATAPSSELHAPETP
jgi:hypothetical protein